MAYHIVYIHFYAVDACEYNKNRRYTEVGNQLPNAGRCLSLHHYFMGRTFYDSSDSFGDVYRKYHFKTLLQIVGTGHFNDDTLINYPTDILISSFKLLHDMPNSACCRLHPSDRIFLVFPLWECRFDPTL